MLNPIGYMDVLFDLKILQLNMIRLPVRAASHHEALFIRIPCPLGELA
ncbi:MULTISPECIES: hypothetical protein [Paenibacillus]|nr:hypothetical protein [Paenibacillus sp. IHBB 10380]